MNLHKCLDCDAIIPRTRKRCEPCARADKRKRARSSVARGRMARQLGIGKCQACGHYMFGAEPGEVICSTCATALDTEPQLPARWCQPGGWAMSNPGW